MNKQQLLKLQEDVSAAIDTSDPSRRPRLLKLLVALEEVISTEEDKVKSEEYLDPVHYFDKHYTEIKFKMKGEIQSQPPQKYSQCWVRPGEVTNPRRGDFANTLLSYDILAANRDKMVRWSLQTQGYG